MSVIGISMMKDSEDVVRGVIEHMAEEVDHIIVADNNSTDGTRAILDELSTRLPLTIIDDPVEAYYQSAKMTALAQIAADMGAHAIVPFDDDELHFSRDGRIRDVLTSDMSPGTAVAIPLYNHWVTLVDDPNEPDPFRRIQWRHRVPGMLHKVAYIWSQEIVIDMGNHGLSRRNEHGDIVPHDGLTWVNAGMEVRHFPMRSHAQFLKKTLNGARALGLTDLPSDIGAHWRGHKAIYDIHGVSALYRVFDDYYCYSVPWESDMLHDPAPYRRWEA
jgi:glycosyltransferase involved in cell wall biosynthesis